MQIVDCIQNSPEWYEARRGIPTASEFATILAKGKDGGASLTRRTYLRKLAGEILTGECAESYSNSHLERGKAMEPEARDMYALSMDVEPELVGFVRNGKIGCSPDSFIGLGGVLEIKTALPHLLIGYIEADKFPAEHVAQCQGALWVTEREWVDIAIYWPKLPLFVKRAYRDEEYIAKLSDAVDAFCDELQATVDRVRSYSFSPPPVRKQALPLLVAC